MQKKLIYKTNISLGGYIDFVDFMDSLVQNTQSSYVSVCNVHLVIECFKSKKIRSAVNGADLIAPDGQPIATAVKLFYGVKQPRVAGMDLICSLFERSEARNYSVFLYGSTEDTLMLMRKRIAKDYPNLRIAGCISPPFKELNNLEKVEIVSNINDTNPDFLLISLGCPKQDLWMCEHKDKINACMIGLGAAFPVFAGQSRAPQWMRSFGLEWVFRLAQEPKRLWKRYLFTNAKFLMLFPYYLCKSWMLRITQK